MAITLGPVSWERMSNAVEKVRERLLRSTAALKAAGVPYAVIGGNAVAAWVSRADESMVRNTRDVDLLLRREHLPDAVAALQQAGFHHRRVSSLGRPGTMDVFLESAESRVGDGVHIVFAGEKTLPDQIEPAAGVEQSEDAEGFRLIALEALVRMKLTAFRDKDRVHLRDLAEVGLIDATWPARFSAPLAERLQKILDTPEG